MAYPARQSWLGSLFKRKPREPVGTESVPAGTGYEIPDFIFNYLKDGTLEYSQGNRYMSSDTYNMLLARACIDKIATECSKAEPMLLKPNRRIEYFATKYPNDYETVSQFIARAVTCLLIDNNAYIIPILDKYDRTSGLWVADSRSAQVVEIDGKLWLKYSMNTGIPNEDKYIIEYERVGHLKRMQGRSLLMGEDNSPFKKLGSLYEMSMDKSLGALEANDSPLRWLGQINVPILEDEDLKEEQKRMQSLNLAGNKTGLFIYDSRYQKLEQIKTEMKLMSPDDLKEMQKMACQYWGVSEAILQNKYTEDEWNGFYQSRIEPILIQIAQVLTRVIYTPGQIMDGNGIEMSPNRLQYASIKSRVDVAFGTYDRGMATMDSALDILNLPPLPNGEGNQRYIRGEYRAEGSNAPAAFAENPEGGKEEANGYRNTRNPAGTEPELADGSKEPKED